MSTWTKVRIKDVAQPKGLVGGPFGSKLVGRDYVESGVPVIRGQNLGSGRWVSLANSVYVTPEKMKRDLGGNLAEAGDLIFTQRGTLGQVAIMAPDAPPSVISQSQMRLRVDSSKADSAYVYYWCTSPEFRQSISDHAIIAGVPHINLGILGALPLSLPARHTQRAIVKVLGTIEDLIENNRRRVEVLEMMTRSTYHEWFVKFRYPGHSHIPMVESALGPIPEGWGVGVIDDLLTIVKMSVDPATIDPDTPAVGLEHIPRQQLTLADWGTAREQGSRKGVFARGDILFGKIRPYFHKVSVAPVDGICSTDAIAIRPLEPYWGQVVAVVSSTDFVAYAAGTSNGTKMPRADWKVIGQWPVPVPPASLAARFTTMARDQLGMAERLMFENRSLEALRDLLLPKLMTGQIDVSRLDLDALLVEQVA